MISYLEQDSAGMESLILVSMETGSAGLESLMETCSAGLESLISVSMETGSAGLECLISAWVKVGTDSTEARATQKPVWTRKS